jgi:hypothetical protein
MPLDEQSALSVSARRDDLEAEDSENVAPRRDSGHRPQPLAPKAPLSENIQVSILWIGRKAF